MLRQAQTHKDPTDRDYSQKHQVTFAALFPGPVAHWAGGQRGSRRQTELGSHDGAQPSSRTWMCLSQERFILSYQPAQRGNLLIGSKLFLIAPTMCQTLFQGLQQ